MEAEKCTFFPLQLGLFSPIVGDFRRKSPIDFPANKELMSCLLDAFMVRGPSRKIL